MAKIKLTETQKKAEWKAYMKALNEAVDTIFNTASAVGIDDKKLARMANLSLKTVTRLCELQTRFPRFQTVWKLAKALKMRITFTKASMIHDVFNTKKKKGKKV